MSPFPAPAAILEPFLTTASSVTVAIAASKYDNLANSVRAHYCSSCFAKFQSVDASVKTKAGTLDVATAVKECFALCRSIFAYHQENSDSYQSTTSSFLGSLNKLPYTLMEDLFTLSKTDDLTSLVSRFLTMSGEDSSVVKEGVSGKGVETGKLILIRFCNSLTGRLLRTSSAVLIGSMLTFISSNFKVTERSGVNVKGELRGGEYEVEEEEVWKDKNREAVVDDSGDTEYPVDYPLYKSFWSLQNLLSSPYTIIQTKQSANEFVDTTKRVLEAFEGCQRGEQDREWGRKRYLEEKKEGQVEEMDDKEKDAFNPAYLTAASLLRLQLRDPSVSQNVLVQLYITITYLSSPFAKTLMIPQSNKSVKDLLIPLLKRVKRMIAESTPNGEELYRMVKEVDEGEWGQWKKDGCKAFEKDPSDEPQPPPKKKRLASAMEEYNYGGTADAEEIKAAAKGIRSAVPVVESYLEEYVDALDPESGIEEEYHPGNDPSFCWRGMRLLVRQGVGLDKAGKGMEEIVREVWKGKGIDIPRKPPPAEPAETTEPADTDAETSMEIDSKPSKIERKNSITKFEEDGTEKTVKADGGVHVRFGEEAGETEEGEEEEGEEKE